MLNEIRVWNVLVRGTMKSVVLNNFQVIKPKNCVSQKDLLVWIIKCHQLAEEKKISENKIDPELIQKLFQRYSVNFNQVSQRYFESDDILSENFEEHSIYKIDADHDNGINIKDRAHFFSEKAFEVIKKFYQQDLTQQRPDHLIHVTCTGYISPSAAQRIVIEEDWQHSTDITHAYHMGCYASLPAIRLATSLVRSEDSSNSQFIADIVHNELCGLHMNASVHTPEQMVVQTLFADGHIKYSVSSQPKAPGENLKVLAILEKIIPNSVGDMSWVPAPFGMQMNLSREVPAKIKPELKLFSEELFKKANISSEQALKSVFAIHPGGPKIIDSVQEILGLLDEQITESRKILFERGNMSSATLPHVWNEILTKQYPVGTIIISFAFGPGLTLFGSAFEVC